MPYIKRLGKKIPGERILVKSSDPDYEYEEVRTCYDKPTYLPKYDENPDDEDLSDCKESERLESRLQNERYDVRRKRNLETGK